jgi:hypothetical protein
MSDTGPFRSAEEEIVALRNEMLEIKEVLRRISTQMGMIDRRLDRVFPRPKASPGNAGGTKRKSLEGTPSIDSGEALKIFDNLIFVARTSGLPETSAKLRSMNGPDLKMLAREIGVVFSRSKPSVSEVVESIQNKVRESIMLSTHTTVEHPPSSDNR